MNYLLLLEVLRIRQKIPENLVIGEFLRLHKTYQHIISTNEATHCEFICTDIWR
ncbi:hypothetical protein RhiirA4_250668 [Rhizophagus irregularis]|uniref:Uncharacterized protein n=1 Tax=Rhizophagus irregularis TaxID=588596 RepID=A0A2I1GSV1_9GLOM|nr:hypothetical protein RhiirA4_250668 [Rhizophagus irregularis]